MVHCYCNYARSLCVWYSRFHVTRNYWERNKYLWWDLINLGITNHSNCDFVGILKRVRATQNSVLIKYVERGGYFVYRLETASHWKSMISVTAFNCFGLMAWCWIFYIYDPGSKIKSILQIIWSFLIYRNFSLKTGHGIQIL